jgi:hypothetical protein
MIWRLAAILIVLLLGAAVLDVGWQATTRMRRSTPVAASAPTSAPPSAPAAGPSPVCGPTPAFADAAAQNAASLGAARWSAMGPPETGWEIYAPLAARELATPCAPADAGFAQALASWQGQHGQSATGIMDEATLKALDVVWLRRRPFVEATAHGACPPPPQPFRLAFATPAEGYEHKPIQLRTTTLAAYRRLVAAARQDLPSAFADPRVLTIFSGYRDPAEEAARCADGGCGTAAKASCSAHRTGLAMDLYLGAAPGYSPESSADANRLFQSRTGIYRWLVANAARFGFVPYPFEPWHWEWTGEPL